MIATKRFIIKLNLKSVIFSWPGGSNFNILPCSTYTLHICGFNGQVSVAGKKRKSSSFCSCRNLTKSIFKWGSIRILKGSFQKLFWWLRDFRYNDIIPKTNYLFRALKNDEHTQSGNQRCRFLAPTRFFMQLLASHSFNTGRPFKLPVYHTNYH